MENVTTYQNRDGAEQVTIDWGNDQFTSMAKADYEASTLPSNSSIPQAGE